MNPSGTNVLLIDSNSARRRMLAGHLRRSGFVITEVGSGGEALRLLDDRPLDAVVLHAKLPDMSGLALCEAVRGRGRYRFAPLVHLSTQPIEPEQRTADRPEGPDAYLVEPIHPGELAATLTALSRYYQARRLTDRLVRRLTLLARATIELNAVTTLPELLAIAVTEGAAIFECPSVVIAEGADGQRLAVSAAGPGQPPAIQPWPDDRHDEDVRGGATVTDEPVERWPMVEWPGGGPVRVVAARPRPDRPPVYLANLAAANDPGSPILNQLSQAIAGAIEAMRSFDEERRIAVTLQRSLLPRVLPRPAGFDVAVRYVPASARAEVGGDFYELAALNGRVVAAIGDVVGHSLHAATVMAELRHAIRAYVVEGHGPGEALNRLNTMMLRLIPDEIATVCLLELDPATGHVTMANAGHPPPLLSVGGDVSFVEQRASLLGIRSERPPDLEFTLPPGGTLVLYTDGLVERRGQVIDEGLRVIATVAAQVDDDLEKFADRLLADAAAEEGEDDIAVLALRRRLSG